MKNNFLPKGHLMSTNNVTGHESNPANAQITITADDPTHGNASHNYHVTGPPDAETGICPNLGVLQFQNGPVSADGNGVNGITHEALLAIIRHRMQGFQSGPYACRENEMALTKIEEALDCLHSRTREREARGVKGTHKV